MFRTRRAYVTMVSALLAGPLVLASPAQALDDTAVLKFAPKQAEVVNGATVDLTVKVNTGGQDVNTVQFYIDLPSGFDCAGVALTGPWEFTASTLCDGTAAALAVGTTSPVNGTVGVGVVTLQAVEAGTFAVKFTRDKSLVVSAETSEDILKRTKKATVVVVPATAWRLT